MKAVVAAFNQEKALVGAFSVITNLRMQLFEALLPYTLHTLSYWSAGWVEPGSASRHYTQDLGPVTCDTITFVVIESGYKKCAGSCRIFSVVRVVLKVNKQLMIKEPEL